MAETPVWPAYQIGSHDSIFALGVVSLVGGQPAERAAAQFHGRRRLSSPPPIWPAQTGEAWGSR